MSLRRRVQKTRAQQFGDELSDGFDHLRSAAVIAAERTAEAVAPRVDSAREALAPRVDAAREALGPRVEAARDRVGPRVDAARQAATRSWDNTVQAMAPVVSAASDGARRATHQARQRADAAGDYGRAARKQARARADKAARALRADSPRRRRKWPWMLGILALGATAGVAAAIVSRRSTPQWEEYEPEHQFAEHGGQRGAFDSPAEQATEAVDATHRPSPSGTEPASEATAAGSEGIQGGESGATRSGSTGGKQKPSRGANARNVDGKNVDAKNVDAKNIDATNIDAGSKNDGSRPDGG